MTDAAELTRRARYIVAAVMDVGEDRLTADTHLHHDLGADDLKRLEILFEAEALYDLEFTDDEGETVRTVGDLARLLQARLEVEA